MTGYYAPTSRFGHPDRSQPLRIALAGHSPHIDASAEHDAARLGLDSADRLDGGRAFGAGVAGNSSPWVIGTHLVRWLPRGELHEAHAFALAPLLTFRPSSEIRRLEPDDRLSGALRDPAAERPGGVHEPHRVGNAQ